MMPGTKRPEPLPVTTWKVNAIDRTHIIYATSFNVDSGGNLVIFSKTFHDNLRADRAPGEEWFERVEVKRIFADGAWSWISPVEVSG